MKDRTFFNKDIYFKCFKTKSFIISLCIIFFSIIVNIINNTKYDDFKALNTIGYDNLFIFCAISNPILEIFSPLVPVIALLSSMKKIKNENKISKIITPFIISGSVFIIVSLFVLLVFFIVNPFPGNTIRKIDGLCTGLYYNSKLLYILFYITHSFVFGGIFGLLGFCIYYYSDSRFYALISSILLYRISNYIPPLPDNINNFLNLFILRFPYEIMDYGNSLLNNLCQLSLVLLFTLILLIIKMKKEDY